MVRGGPKPHKPRRSPRNHGGQVSPVQFKRPVTPKQPFRRSSRQQNAARQSGNKQKAPGRQKRSAKYLKSIAYDYPGKRSTYTRHNVVDAIILKLHTMMPNGAADPNLAVTSCYPFKFRHRVHPSGTALTRAAAGTYILNGACAWCVRLCV